MISALSLRTSEMNSLLIKMKYILYRIFFSGNINMKDENGRVLQKEEYQVIRDGKKTFKTTPKTQQTWGWTTPTELDTDCLETSRSAPGIKMSEKQKAVWLATCTNKVDVAFFYIQSLVEWKSCWLWDYARSSMHRIKLWKIMYRMIRNNIKRYM